MEELTLKKNHHRKVRKKVAEKVIEPPAPPKEKTLKELYELWRDEQYNAMEDALKSAFDDNYEILTHEWDSKEFYAQEKGNTIENADIMGSIVDIHSSGPLWRMRSSLKYTIIIRFPELQVREGRRSHTTRNTFVMLRLSPAFNSVMHTYMQGNRTTFTYAEASSDYAFSHLSGGHRPAWRDFCLGHTQFAFLCTELCNGWDKNKFLGFCFQLGDYLSWESQEGGPFKSIADIRERDVQNTGAALPGGGMFQEHYRRLLELQDEIPIEFVKNKYHWAIRVKSGEEFDLLCTKCVTNTQFLLDYDPVTKVKTTTVTSNKASLIEQHMSSNRGRYVVFKDTRYNYEIIDSLDIPVTDTPKIANDGTVQQLYNKLNQLFLNRALREYRKQ